MKAVDLFAGWGGFTEGATAAGADVLFAANHWPLAVEAHASNHPNTEHACQDLRQMDWATLPKHDVLLASPACQGHSPAANASRKRDAVANAHDALRATSWAVVDCVEVCRPSAFVVENVPRFARWGPNGKPGAFFEHWLDSFRIRGYEVEVRMLWAHKHGTPQRRKRAFVIGTMPGVRVPNLTEEAEPAFGPCIEWESPAPWTLVADGTPKVRERIERSRPRHGARFLSQHTRDHMGVSLSESIRTITGGDQWIIVDGDRYRPLTIRENARAMGFRDSYSWPKSASRGETILGLGNAVCPPLAEKVVGAIMAAL